ncbi:uncharacterized protein F5891DRAFT_1027480 [Suillus fuscotomentosus]|uniref:Uncharacterized protein n=1 Tax=Suillus fuscotomentosus TaxID=1912939 RepID=A0AAD4EB36_9AGAM|nr:uncharacterized protein F5891DRAFT_1027480 [Suillus fuscotomentosus]KAG1901683.1 hypothetical protein F5891DRAFT_1027480 [Suillus fuscotomentosus]
MDDISEKDPKRDIRTFVSHELKKVSGLGDKEFAVLANRAGGLFEWACLACNYIRDIATGSPAIDRLNDVVSHNDGEQENLLYGMYNFILGQNMRREKHVTEAGYQRALAKFHSVMGQVLGSAKPLSLDALNAMRCHFPDKSEHYGVELVVGDMGLLLSGTTNSSSAIRPLHASFRELIWSCSLSSWSQSGRFSNSTAQGSKI